MKPEIKQLEDPETTGKIFDLVKQLTLMAMTRMSDETGSQVEALSMGVAAVAGALHGVAAICGQREGINGDSSVDEQRSTVNDVSALVAALLVAKATHQHDDGLVLQLNPIIYLAVVKAAETILGEKVDGQLNPSLVAAARRWETENGYFGGWKDQTASHRNVSHLN